MIGEGLCVVVLTKNEEKHIRPCLQAVPAGVPVVVVDSGSSDDTVAIARACGAEVLERPWTGFADQRNFAIEQLRNRYSWLLFIDADERFSLEFFSWCRENLPIPEDVVYVSQRIVIGGRTLQHAPGYPIWHPRLVRSSPGVFVANNTGHGETVVASASRRNVDIPYLHFVMETGISRWLEKHVRLAELESIERGKEVGTATTRARLGRVLRSGAPRVLARFIFHYVWCRGFLDGRAGLHYSLLYTWYEFTKWMFVQDRGLSK